MYPGDVGGCLGPALNLELAQDARDVVLHGLVREMDRLGDLPVGVALRHQVEDVLLLGGESSKSGVPVVDPRTAQAFEDPPGDRRVQEALAGGDLADHIDEVVAADLLQDVGGRSRHDRVEQGLVV